MIFEGTGSAIVYCDDNNLFIEIGEEKLILSANEAEKMHAWTRFQLNEIKEHQKEKLPRWKKWFTI
jgi:hypothetical protein